MGPSSSPSDREAIVRVRHSVRLKIIDPSGSITLGRLWAAGNPISCVARKRIRAIENFMSRLLRPLIQRQVMMLIARADKLNPTSRRATLQPPLPYCVTEFGRLFVRRNNGSADSTCHDFW
jgi:hypothetical protein